MVMDNKSFIARATKLFAYFINKALPNKLRAKVESVTEGEDSLKKGTGVLIDSVRAFEKEEIPYFLPNKRISEQLDSLEKDAQQGCSDAQHRLGVLYLTGIGVVTNVAQAKTYLEKSAQSGNAE